MSYHHVVVQSRGRRDSCTPCSRPPCCVQSCRWRKHGTGGDRVSKPSTRFACHRQPAGDERRARGLHRLWHRRQPGASIVAGHPGLCAACYHLSNGSAGRFPAKLRISGQYAEQPATFGFKTCCSHASKHVFKPCTLSVVVDRRHWPPRQPSRTSRRLPGRWPLWAPPGRTSTSRCGTSGIYLTNCSLVWCSDICL